MKNITQQSLRKVAAVLVGLCSSLLVSAQRAIDRAEYFWDDDPGYDQATPLTITSGGTVSTDVPLPAPASPGSHLLGVRYHGDNGWSTTITQFVTVQRSETTRIVRAEYFWDDDPGFGQGTPLLITPGSSVSVESLVALSGNPAPGNHLLGLRFQGTNGWSPTITQYVTVLRTETTKILQAEYFWDDDPGFGQGTPLSITPGSSVDIDRLIALTDGLASGKHQLGLRYRGTNGWSPTTTHEVYKPRKEAAEILSAEYFWNDDPGFGQGTPISITPGEEVSLDNFGIPTFTVHGDATLFIRYRGTNGWSPTVSQVVMVDAEGHYTLNASAETSMEDRNYQSLTDALSDFTDRGIGNSIEMEVTTQNTVYELDATNETIAQQVLQAADNLQRLSDSREQKTISFTAAAGSANTVSITAQSLQQVMPLLAMVKTENVTLLVNGTEYCFNALTQRQQTLCPATATDPVSLSTIGNGIAATWTAQPHAATVLSGFTTESTTDLPAMTIQNTGTATDSVAYAVSLTLDGQPLYDYTYYIYARASMANQAFNAMLPADGSSLDPGTATLSWNDFQEAEGYRLTVTDITDTAAPATVLDGFTVETSNYPLPVASGHRYTWQVTAIGPCDELQSPLMTMEGRLLPDLAVTAITLPEGAQGGNQLTVSATIANQGEGATTEQEWTDRLYCIIDGTDFDQATLMAELKHTGRLAAGESYTAQFTMRVPAVESGSMRVFVVTDATEKVMETDDTNNRLLSATAATLAPFYMNTTDLAALRQLYQQLEGDSWNGTRWNTASELVVDSYWSGVSFNTDGRVTAINLQGRGLSGSLTTAVNYVATLSQLTTLNLSRNALTGDPASFLKGVGSQLTNVNLSYNRLGELSGPLPATITTLDLSNQCRQYNNSRNFPGFSDQQPVMLNIGSNMTIALPPMALYNHANQDFSVHPQINVWKHNASKGLSRLYGKLNWSATNECYVFSITYTNVETTQDETVHLRFEGGAMKDSSWPATMHMVYGDANLTGFIDVTDVQATLNYIIKGSFALSLWAANTWDSDDIINIQDIVCTVNLVLSNQGESTSRKFAPAGAEASEASEAPNRFYASGRYLMLDATESIASFDVELRGVHADQVRLLLPQSDWQMQTRNTPDGVRLVVFSPTGASLPVVSGQQLLKLATTAEPLRAYASNPDAEAVNVAVAGSTNGIVEVDNDEQRGPAYDLGGRRIATDRDATRHSLYIRNGKKIRR